MVVICDQYHSVFKDLVDIEDFFAIGGDVFKTVKKRETLRFDRGGRSFFIKRHRGVGYGEIVKNLVRFVAPVVSAEQEWRAILRFREFGIPTMTPVGFGSKGWNPATRSSFVITEDLGPNITLEKLTEQWKDHPRRIEIKQCLIRQLAQISRSLHRNGLNHRDFYLCHFVLALNCEVGELTSENLGHLFVIDLHRVQIRTRTPRKWIQKDLAGLYFSSMNTGLTRTDRFRFLIEYHQRPLREILRSEQKFWSVIVRRAQELYKKHHRVREH